MRRTDLQLRYGLLLHLDLIVAIGVGRRWGVRGWGAYDARSSDPKLSRSSIQRWIASAATSWP